MPSKDVREQAAADAGRPPSGSHAHRTGRRKPTMADVDYAADVKKYAASLDDAAVKGIVKHLGIALKSNDASMVACSSKSELERIRESWLKKKLALTSSDAELDAAIKDVCERMKADRSKQRVTFYYLLAEKYGKLAALA
jgi:hypothetical protein